MYRQVHGYNTCNSSRFYIHFCFVSIDTFVSSNQGSDFWCLQCSQLTFFIPTWSWFIQIFCTYKKLCQNKLINELEKDTTQLNPYWWKFNTIKWNLNVTLVVRPMHFLDCIALSKQQSIIPPLHYMPFPDLP